MSTGRQDPIPALSQEREVGRIVDLVGYQLRRSYFHSIQLFAAATAGLDITPIQYGMLEAILESGVLVQKDAAARLGSPPQSVVPLVRDLEERGLVERIRSETDRRRHLLAVTRAGLDLLVEVRDLITGVEADLAVGLAPGERDQLLDLLGRLRRGPPV